MLTFWSSATAIDSAALAEKLLNDLLKTTEGFQRLKKMNEELKVQKVDDLKYVSQQDHPSNLNNPNLFLQEQPMQQENERIVRENNELHA